MVRRPALPAPAPPPKARAGEAEGTGLCMGLASTACIPPNSWDWKHKDPRVDLEMRTGHVSPPALLPTDLLSQTPEALSPMLRLLQL